MFVLHNAYGYYTKENTFQKQSYPANTAAFRSGRIHRPRQNGITVVMFRSNFY